MWFVFVRLGDGNVHRAGCIFSIFPCFGYFLAIFCPNCGAPYHPKMVSYCAVLIFICNVVCFVRLVDGIAHRAGCAFN